MCGIQGHRHITILRLLEEWIVSRLISVHQELAEQSRTPRFFSSLKSHFSQSFLVLFFSCGLAQSSTSKEMIKGIMFMKGLNCLQINHRNSWLLSFLFCLFPWQIGPIHIMYFSWPCCIDLVSEVLCAVITA